MTVKATSKPRRLSQKQRAEKLSVRFRRMAEIQAEIDELQAQEDAYQAKKLDETWQKLRSDMEKLLEIDNFEKVELLRIGLTGPGILPILRVAVAPEDVVEPVEEVAEAPVEPVEDSLVVEVQEEFEAAPDTVSSVYSADYSQYGS